MSFLFEKVYFPLIENIIKEREIKQNSRNPSRKKKFTLEDFDSMGNKSNSKSNQKPFIDSEKFSPEGFIKLSSQSNNPTKNEEKNQDANKSQKLSNKQEYVFRTQRKDTQKSSEENIVIILPKHSQKDPSQKDFHNDLKQSLIANASSYGKSQRLETIFQSARKHRTQKSRSSSFQNKDKLYKSNNQKISKEIDVDQKSLRNLRKSFCLKIIDNDEQWEGVFSKSAKQTNNEQ